MSSNDVTHRELFSKIRPTFASQITSSVALAEARSSSSKDTKHSIFVNLRRYRGLKTSGYGVTNKSVTYEAFKLSLTFREAPPEESYNKECFPCSSLPTVNSSMLLVISATPLKSVYKGEPISFKSKTFHQTQYFVE
jgi:period circadian protein 2